MLGNIIGIDENLVFVKLNLELDDLKKEKQELLQALEYCSSL